MEVNILLVDDEVEITDLVEIYLKNEGYCVHKYYDGTQALAAIRSRPFDLAVLDVMLPGVDGFKLCQAIREQRYYPVIMLTARVEDADKILGLTIGADDYMTKPFNPLELVARVKTQLRRYLQYGSGDAGGVAGEQHEISGLVINRQTHKCTLNGRTVSLTPIEFSLLWYLCDNRGRVVSSEELFEAVWGEKFYESNNTVMAHVGRLREKMKEPSRNPKYIKTVWGVGYQIE